MEDVQYQIDHHLSKKKGGREEMQINLLEVDTFHYVEVVD